MATVIDTLITQYKMDADQYERESKKVKRATDDMGDSAGKTGGLLSDLMKATSIGSLPGGGLADLAKFGAQLGIAIVGLTSVVPFLVGALQGLMPLLLAASTGFANFALALAAKPFLDAAAEMDSMKRALASLTGSAENAAIVFAHLREVARVPGINLPGAVGGFNQMFAAGMGASQAIETLREFANALALVGGGPEQMQRVVLALTQIMSKGVGGIKALGEEINQQLAENVPQIKQAMLRVFGTADTEEVAKKYGHLTGVQFIAAIVEELKKGPRATSGIANAFENLKSTMFVAMASIGDAIAAHLLPGLEKVAQLVEYLTETGVLSGIAGSIAKALGADKAEEAMPRFVAMIVAVVEQMPNIIETAKSVFMSILEGGLKLFEYMVTEVSRLQRMLEDQIDAFLPGTPMKDNREMMDWAREQGIIAAPPDMKSLFEAGRESGARIGGSILDRADELLSGMKNWKPKDPGAIPGELDNRGTAVGSVGDRIAEYTRQTAENTRSMREAMRDAIIGGGFFGSKGVTPREAARFINSVVDSRV